MKPLEALHANRAAIRRVIESHHARNARVFGSVLHGVDTDSSDLDILIDRDTEDMDEVAFLLWSGLHGNLHASQDII